MDPRTSAQDVMRCDLCETAVVQMHCDTCLVNLCTACVGKHMLLDESNDHKVVKFLAKKSNTLYPRCTTHFKERCRMNCKQCGIPVCTKCLASDRHLGHKLSEILDIVDEKKNKIIKDQTELKEKIYPTYQDIASDVQNRISQLQKQYGDLSTAITKHGEDWHREIDKLVQKLKAEVNEMKNKQLKTLQKHLDEINKTMSDIKEEIKSVEIAINTNDLSKLFRVTSNVNIYRQLPQKSAPTLPKFIPEEFQVEKIKQLFGTIFLSSFSSDKYGYSMKTTQKSPETGSSPQFKQLLDEAETVTTIDTGYRVLFSVSCLSDEKIWTRGDDKTMKLFSINQGSLLKSITTKSGNMPSNIAVTRSGDLVYTDSYDRTVNILMNDRIEEMIRLQNWNPCGVCSTSSGGLLVTMISDDFKQTRVVRYSGSTEKQTIQFNDKGKPLYSSGGYIRYYITENRNLDICVSDSGARAVVVVNQAGKLRFRYTGLNPAPRNKPLRPQGITTDSQSNILTADYNNECVHIIDQDGQFLSYIDCVLSNPEGICTDTNDSLFVAQCRNRRIKKIKFMC